MLDHEEEASSDVLSINDTATRLDVDDVNDWDWMMGEKMDSYMLIAKSDWVNQEVDKVEMI